jgi:subtilisin family serine protease
MTDVIDMAPPPAARPVRMVAIPRLGLTDERMSKDALGPPARIDPGALWQRVRGGFTSLAGRDPEAEGPLPPIIVHKSGGIAVVGRNFQDGAVVIEADPDALASLERNQQDWLQIVPLTEYKLPSRHPTSAEHEGKLWLDDFKQRLRKKIGPGQFGEGVTVGVIDTGIDPDHPALTGKVDGGVNLVQGESNADWKSSAWGGHPDAWHGTHVAGIIAARGGADEPQGVAHNATLRSYRVFPKHAPGPANNAALIDAIRAAVLDRCDIINMSLEGLDHAEDGVQQAIEFAANQGVLAVAAAGNGASGVVSHPAAHSNCIGVSAIGQTGSYFDSDFDEFVYRPGGAAPQPNGTVYFAKFSNYGEGVNFTAPGVAIVSTAAGGKWEVRSGTSQSAPFVTGLAAILLSRLNAPNPLPRDRTRWTALKSAMVSKARKFGFVEPLWEGQGLIYILSPEE